jgi:hypothetical protein
VAAPSEGAGVLDNLVTKPQLSFLVVYRDGRDVTSSTLHAARTQWRGQRFVVNVDSVEKIASRWVYGIGQMQRHESRVYTVRYEELVADPDRVMAGVSEWLGVDPGGFSLDRVHGQSVGRYREHLTADELDTVNELAGATLAQLRYR